MLLRLFFGIFRLTLSLFLLWRYVFGVGKENLTYTTHTHAHPSFSDSLKRERHKREAWILLRLKSKRLLLGRWRRFLANPKVNKMYKSERRIVVVAAILETPKKSNEWLDEKNDDISTILMNRKRASDLREKYGVEESVQNLQKKKSFLFASNVSRSPVPLPPRAYLVDYHTSGS